MTDHTNSSAVPGAYGRRRRQIQRLVDDGRLNDLAPEPGDERLLDVLTRTGHRTALDVQGWLTMAYLTSTGCYAAPAVRAASRLPALVLDQAELRHPCPPACSGAVGPQCDGCAQVCGSGAHRGLALLFRNLSQALSARQQHAQSLLETPAASE
ncbi:hypothetical protein [Kitasatospora sp. CB01950]|uniref:hypothetical protein n=1 Tax=Kitasatospora sp. CB01950 TaxID=1703930 RepID=UPI00093A8CDB|nr:hypothetical protein [Kitasatospora sp. CB01950]OKI95052.1 hypothetical protein AMK19_32775 [Kitasatospora sp. CB01950]